jgi:hypothetical protein
MNDMIIKLLTDEISYSMAAYFDTLSGKKSDPPSAIFVDSMKFVKALRRQFVTYTLYFIIPAFFGIMSRFLKI